MIVRQAWDLASATNSAAAQRRFLRVAQNGAPAELGHRCSTSFRSEVGVTFVLTLCPLVRIRR